MQNVRTSGVTSSLKFLKILEETLNDRVKAAHYPSLQARKQSVVQREVGNGGRRQISVLYTHLPILVPHLILVGRSSYRFAVHQSDRLSSRSVLNVPEFHSLIST